jgi:hypothetical protein
MSMRKTALALLVAALLFTTPLLADGGQTVGSGGATPAPPGGLIGSGTSAVADAFDVAQLILTLFRLR